MTMFVVWFCTVDNEDLPGTNVPAVFKLAKYVTPGATLPMDPPVAMAAAITPASAEADAVGLSFRPTVYLEPLTASVASCVNEVGHVGTAVESQPIATSPP